MSATSWSAADYVERALPGMTIEYAGLPAIAANAPVVL